jgi:tryptophan synthase alpha subunit
MLSAVTDGIIVGSAIIKLIEAHTIKQDNDLHTKMGTIMTGTIYHKKNVKNLGTYEKNIKKARSHYFSGIVCVLCELTAKK